jgi:hypothetical protein
VLLLRVMLPDRPGSLGLVATAMGTCGADISAIEVVGKQDGNAINDFMLTMPPGTLPDTLVSTCNELDGVRVLWLSRYPDSWGLESDIETLNRMSDDPEHAGEILTEAAPTVFHAQWAMWTSPDRVRVCTQLAPELTAVPSEVFGDLDVLQRLLLPAGWMEGWSETVCAVAPTPAGGAVVIGRQGGPEFLDSEMNRLRHLAAMVR